MPCPRGRVAAVRIALSPIRALVTGAAGFLGGHLRHALLAGGHQVTGVDLLFDHGPEARPPEGIERVEVLWSAPVRGDVRGPS
ncbi:NAD-dependent epimerase/dehydratase family protein [Nocardia sp. NPDC004260]